jgi:hypothetical protein
MIAPTAERLDISVLSFFKSPSALCPICQPTSLAAAAMGFPCRPATLAKFCWH